MVTLKDVAQEAGVSAQLVSHVVNGKAERYRIAPATRQRVEEAAKKLGYDPGNNRGARQMAARKNGERIPNNVIAVCSINESITNGSLDIRSSRVGPYDAAILAGIDAAAYEFGFDVLTCRYRSDELPRLVKNAEVDGVIPIACSVSILDQLVGLQIPMVHLVVSYEPAHLVGIADRQGMYDAVQHLVELGHQKIAYLGFLIDPDFEEPVEYVVSSERFAGYHQAMQENGLTPECVDTSLELQDSIAVGQAVQRLWEESQGEITAVVCHNDSLAMAAIRHLEQQGLNVPGHISVTGFDDMSQEFAFEPAISSVYYDRFKLGYRAVEILRQLREPWLANEKIPLVREVLPVEFKARLSTAPVRHS